MKEMILKVQGMSCGHCVNSVENAMEALGAKAEVELAAGEVKVTFDETALSLGKIKEAIEEQGYDVL